MLTFEKSAERMLHGERLMPGGVGSDFRLGMRPHPLVIDRGEGPYLWDVDGNRLIDYYLGMGPMILGHRPPEVIEAVSRQLESGILFAGQSEIEYEAASIVCELVPCAEMVRFGSSGSEAVQAALRVARAATGRETVIAFEGHYHGWLDNILWNRGGSPKELQPVSRGQATKAGGNVEIHDWNNTEHLVARIDRSDVAAVIMEPSMCNTSAIMPRPGYLEAIREVCDTTGTVLIFDEVITGFRLGSGGAQELLGVTPDLATFGKALASGFPVSCLAGKANLMEMIGGPGRVIHAGTYNGGAPAMAATVATLRTLRDTDAHTVMEKHGNRLMTALRELFAVHDQTAVVQGWPQVFNVAFGLTDEVADYTQYLNADKESYLDFAEALIWSGVRVLERGTWFLSTAHDDEAIDRTLEVVDRVLGDLNST